MLNDVSFPPLYFLLLFSLYASQSVILIFSAAAISKENQNPEASNIPRVILKLQAFIQHEPFKSINHYHLQSVARRIKFSNS